MPARKAYTLLELSVVIAIIAILLAICLPGLEAARRQARLASCRADMHAVHLAVLTYANANNLVMPPFMMDDSPERNGRPDLAAAGHWGGLQQYDLLFRYSKDERPSFNLWVLVEERSITPRQLLCPGSSLAEGRSFFSHTTKFSTYCRRFPYSNDLATPSLPNPYYLFNHWQFATKMKSVNPRQVRLCNTYTVPTACGGDGRYEPACDSMLSDVFFRDGFEITSANSLPVSINRCHQQLINTLSGDGSVATRDVAREAIQPLPEKLPAIENGIATESLWQIMDRRTSR